MNSLDVFNRPELETAIHQAAGEVVNAFAGGPCPVALAVLFQAWLAIAKMGDVDPGVEFERLLATYEARQMTTHRAGLGVH